MAAILKLVANPTFKSKVGIPVAGGETVDVEFTFKHRTRTDLVPFVQPEKDRDDLDMMMECVIGWDLAEEFNRQNASIFLENYGGAAYAIYLRYLEELTGQRSKN